MRENVWTEDGVALLRKLWAEGATAAAIGRRLGGFSRSAVLGKVFRLRLDGGEEGGTARRNTVRRKQRASESAAPVRRRKRQPRQRIVAPPVKPAGRLTLLELTNENCRWPLHRRGKYFVCGVAEADVQGGIPYCPRHMRRAYTDAVSFEKSRRSEFVRNVKSPNIAMPA